MGHELHISLLSFSSVREKPDLSWRLRVNYHKLNQMVVPIIAAVPDVAFLLE